MFTVKLFRGGSPHPTSPAEPRAIMIVQVDKIEILSTDRGTKHLIFNPGADNEWHEYVSSAATDDGARAEWNWAVIENAAGKTTQIIQP